MLDIRRDRHSKAGLLAETLVEQHLATVRRRRVAILPRVSKKCVNQNL
jgi:hypothetical protein